MFTIDGLNEAARREARGLGQIIQAKECVRYVEGVYQWDWRYPNQKLAGLCIQSARKHAGVVA